MTKKSRPTKKPSYQRGRPDSIIINIEDSSYSEMLKKIKADKRVQDASQALNAISKTRLGHVRIELNRKASNVDSLKTAVSQATGNEKACKLLSDTTKIEIRDVDEEATEKEVMQAILQRTGDLNTPVPLLKRNTGRGTHTIVTTVPVKVAASLTKERLRIGYVNCRVHRLTKVKKCFKCQSYGHTRGKCTSND